MSFTKTYDVSMDEAFALLEKIERSVENISKKEALDEVAFTGAEILSNEIPLGYRQRGIHTRNTVVVKHVDDDTREVYPTKTVDGIPVGNMIQLGSTNRVKITPKKAPYLVFYWRRTGKWHKRLEVTRGIIPPNDIFGRSARYTGIAASKLMGQIIGRNLP